MTTEANHEQWESALRDTREIVESYLNLRDAINIHPLTATAFLHLINCHSFALYKALPRLTDEQYWFLWRKVDTNEWVIFDKPEMQAALGELLRNLVELFSKLVKLRP